MRYSWRVQQTVCLLLYYLKRAAIMSVSEFKICKSNIDIYSSKRSWHISVIWWRKKSFLNKKLPMCRFRSAKIVSAIMCRLLNPSLFCRKDFFLFKYFLFVYIILLVRSAWSRLISLQQRVDTLGKPQKKLFFIGGMATKALPLKLSGKKNFFKS